jgi:hypothetical protein
MEADYEKLEGVTDKGHESYHQDYYIKSPIRYKAYRWNCGRDKRLKEIWGDKAISSLNGKCCPPCLYKPYNSELCLS